MKKVTTLLILIVFPIVFSACSLPLQNPATVPETIEQTQTESIESADIQDITIEATESGQNAYELLKSNHQVESKEYDFGVMIESIDGVENTSKNYWAFYLNDEYAQQGADQTELQAGDVVRFSYEEITDSF